MCHPDDGIIRTALALAVEGQGSDEALSMLINEVVTGAVVVLG